VPTYEYECDGCGHAFEQQQSFAEEPLTQCPVCRVDSLRRVQFAPFFFVRDVTTVGQLAEANTKRLGRDGLAERNAVEAEQRAARKRQTAEKIAEATGGSVPDPVAPATPWWRSGEVPGTTRMDKPLDLSKVRDLNTYVETGKTT
jgi:putative FmdB family regulatory protein